MDDRKTTVVSRRMYRKNVCSQCKYALKEEKRFFFVKTIFKCENALENGAWPCVSGKKLTLSCMNFRPNSAKFNIRRYFPAFFKASAI